MGLTQRSVRSGFGVGFDAWAGAPCLRQDQFTSRGTQNAAPALEYDGSLGSSVEWNSEKAMLWWKTVGGARQGLGELWITSS
jgi:hypothetical protein